VKEPNSSVIASARRPASPMFHSKSSMGWSPAEDPPPLALNAAFSWST